jgi:hypothetical protein
MAHILRFGEKAAVYGKVVYGQLLPDHPVAKGRHGVGTDYIPKNRDEYRAWLLNLKTQIPTVGAALGLEAGAITAVQTTCTAQITRIDARATAEAEFEAKAGAETEGRATTDAALREEVGEWKHLAGWSDENAAILQVQSSATTFDPATYKPEFKVHIVGGEIRLDWKKKGVDSMRIYGRLRGQSVWTLLGVDTSSPYIDGRPLAQAGVAETREYMLRGAINDEAIGLDSDIQSITWSGA